MRLYLSPKDRRPDPEPLVTDDRTAVVVGTVVWLVLLGVMLLRRDDLLADGRGWWVWTCVAGAALGGLGLVYLHRREVRER